MPVDGEIYFLRLRPIYSWFYILCVCPKRFCLWQSPIPGRAQQEAQLGQARTGQKRQRPNGAVQPCHIRTVGLLYLGTCTYDFGFIPPLSHKDVDDSFRWTGKKKVFCLEIPPMASDLRSAARGSRTTAWPCGGCIIGATTPLETLGLVP